MTDSRAFCLNMAGAGGHHLDFDGGEVVLNGFSALLTPDECVELASALLQWSVVVRNDENKGIQQ